MSRTAGIKNVVRAAASYVAITVVTLVLLDLVLMAAGLFEPPSSYGHPTLGWVSGPATGSMQSVTCWDEPTRQSVSFHRNERGYRTPHSEVDLAGENDWFEIAVSGDSHTDQCMTNEEMHFGVMAEALTTMGTKTTFFSYGAGRYSPLQQYLAVRDGIADFDPDVLVLNLYTGNDFYDILRVDDRPYFVDVGGRYEIAEPVWYVFDPPGARKRSRVLYSLGIVADRVGVANIWTRLRYLRATAREQGAGVGAVFSYLVDIRRATTSSAGYPAAFAAQMLNQQLFLLHFPGSAEESLSRRDALMQMIRESHPDMLMVMSPIPSYQLARQEPIDGAFLEVLERLPVTYTDGVRSEAELYERLRVRAEAAGWLFVDNLAALDAYQGEDRLYQDFDYHITRAAMRVIGRNQATAILGHLESSTR